MRIRVLAFAVMRERLGFSERSLEVPAGSTAGEVAARALGGPVPKGLALAVNQELAAPETVLEDGDELALLPPVSGGQDLPLGIQAEPIDVPELIARTSDGSCGAVLVFLGTARETPGDRLVHLEYEAYAPMAERFFAEVAEEIHAQHGVERVSIVHRTGVLGVGEPSVAIVVASPHRAAGFAALRHAIERIKEAAPVWKKEVTEGRAHWVESERLDTGPEPDTSR